MTSTNKLYIEDKITQIEEHFFFFDGLLYTKNIKKDHREGTFFPSKKEDLKNIIENMFFVEFDGQEIENDLLEKNLEYVLNYLQRKNKNIKSFSIFKTQKWYMINTAGHTRPLMKHFVKQDDIILYLPYCLTKGFSSFHFKE